MSDRPTHMMTPEHLFNQTIGGLATHGLLKDNDPKPFTFASEPGCVRLTGPQSAFADNVDFEQVLPEDSKILVWREGSPEKRLVSIEAKTVHDMVTGARKLLR